LFAASDHCQSGIMTHRGRRNKLLTFWYQKLLMSINLKSMTPSKFLISEISSLWYFQSRESIKK
jgi:hypothetical protein